jgi:hypothetical protein
VLVHTEHKDYYLSPYLDILSHFFHKPWRKVSVKDRVGLMVTNWQTLKMDLCYEVLVQLKKHLTEHDVERFDEAISLAKEVMVSAGVC